MRISYLTFPILSCLLIVAHSLSSFAENTTKSQHGFSPLHELKYKEGFQAFGYVNPEAPKGGRIRVGRRGSFDTLNFLKYPGRSPAGRMTAPIKLINYLYDTMVVVSADETAGYYNLLAKEIEVDKQYRWVRFVIRDDAKWHDGQPITADDVVFTFHTLKSQAAPVYKQLLRGISVSKTGEREVLYRSVRPGNRDFVQITGSLPVHPKHFWDRHDVTKGGLRVPLASGPYRIIRVEAGKSIRLERVKNYWAANHPVNKGRYNFDQIDLEFYMDDGTALTAFKAGQFDFRMERSAIQWATAYKSIDPKKIKLSSVHSNNPGSLVRLIFNIRRDIFKDRRVRQAFAVLYDFEKLNDTLFHGQYENVDSVFGGSVLSATDRISDLERTLLAGFKDKLPEGFLQSPAPPWRTKTYNEREARRLAGKLLDEAGYKLVDGKRVGPGNKKPISLTVVFSNPAHHRVLASYANKLSRVGIELKFPMQDPISAHKALLEHKYDLVLTQSHASIATGPREELIWGSRNADAKRSYAFAGVKDKDLDRIISAMKNASSLEDMQMATRAFDRILRWQVYDLPLWKTSKKWIAYSTAFGRPQITPEYELSFIDRWWYLPKEVKQSKLQKQ